MTIHCILLDAETGRVLGRHEWSVLLSRIAIIPTDSGDFVVRENHELVLYSFAFRPLARFPLDRRDQDIRGHGYEIEATPGVKSIVVLKWLDTGVELKWLDPSTLGLQRQWRLPGRLGGAPYSLAASRKFVSELVPEGLFVSPVGGSPRQIYGSAQGWDRDSFFDVTQRFVTSDELFLCRLESVRLIRADGEVLFTETLPDREYTYANDAQVSAAGNRLAIPVLKREGIDSELLNLSSHDTVKRILIYDLPTMRLAWQFDGKQLGTKHVTAMALSPVGSRVALLRAGAVELYKLPE